MQIEMTDEGPMVRADQLAPLLGIDPAELQRLMREGEVTSRHEQGIDEDAGRFRLVFRYRDRMVRLTCTDDGKVISRTAISIPNPGQESD